MTRDFTLLDLTKEDLKKLIEKYDSEKIKFTAKKSINLLEERIKNIELRILSINKIIEESNKDIIEYNDRIKITKLKIEKYRNILKEFYGE